MDEMDEMDGLQILKNRPLPIKPHEFFIGEGRFCMYLYVPVCTCVYLYVCEEKISSAWPAGRGSR